MIKTKITCNACHNSVIINGETKKEIGSPFVECPWCHNVVLTNKAKEWNTMNKIQKFFWLMNSGYGNFFLLVCGCICLSSMIGMALNLSEPFSIIFMWILTLLLLAISSTAIFMFKLKSDKIQLSIRESNYRLKDPKYRKLLEKAGFTIYDYCSNDNEDIKTGIRLTKKDIKNIDTEYLYINFMHRSAVCIIIERYMLNKEDCSVDEFVELMNDISQTVAQIKNFITIDNIVSKEDVLFGIKGKMKTLRIKWNNGFEHDSEIVAFYDNSQAFYFIITNGNLYEMYMDNHARGMDCIAKEFDGNGNYIIEHINEICDYIIVAEYPGFDGFYQNSLRNNIVNYLKEHVE